MSSFNILIADQALKDAFIEQLKPSGDHRLIENRELADIVAPNASIAILDQASLDKKMVKQLRDLKNSETRPIVLLLGNPRPEDEDLFTESFSKPIRLGHVLGRLKFYTELAPKLRSVTLTFGPYRLEAQNRQIVIVPDKGTIRLTEKEVALLEYLGQSEHPVGREELLAAIWGYNQAIETHTLETHIYQLRRKLDPENKGENWLINEQGSYRLNREGMK